MRALLRFNRAHLLAIVALILGIGLCAGTLARAIQVDVALPASLAADTLTIPDVPARGREADGDVAIDAAVNVDPFHPARTRPGARYVPGGAAAMATAQPATPPRVPVPMLRLHGVVTQPNGGLAAISANGRPAQVVRVGQTIEGLKLTRVQPSAATLTRPDTTLVVRLPGTSNQP
jgi:hypothetical protein